MYGLGDIVFALGIVRPQVLERPEQSPAVKAIVANVHFADGLLLIGAVIFFHDPQQSALIVPHDSAVSRGIVQPRGGQRNSRLGGAVPVEQSTQRLCSDQRHVAGDDQYVAVVFAQCLAAHHHSVAGAQLFRLLDPVDPAVAGERVDDTLLLMADNHVQCLDAGLAAGVQHVSEHRLAAQFVQHFRQITLHPRALAGSENNCSSRTHGTTVSKLRNRTLARLDSNQERQDQNLVCCHYTTG